MYFLLLLLFLLFFFSFHWRSNRRPVSSKAVNFALAEWVLFFRCSLAICKHFWNIFWDVSSPSSGRHSFDSLYCANVLAGGKHAEDNSFDPSESASSCNLVFQLCKYYPHTYNLLLLSHLHFYYFISNSAFSPVSPGAASHFPKKRSDFYERSLDGYTTAQDFTAPFFQTFKPFFTALVVCNIFGLNCISATKCDFHIFNFLLSVLQYNSPPFKFIVQKKSLGLKWRLTSEASGIVRHWKQHPGLHAPLVWSNRAAPVFLESLQKVFGLNWAQPGLSIYLALAEQVWKLRDGRQVSGCDPNLCWSSGLALWRSEGISEGRKNLSLYLLQTIANFRNKSGKYQSYMPSLFCFCLSFKSKMDVNVKLSNRNSVSE